MDKDNGATVGNGILDIITSRLAIIGGIVTAIVTLNTTITGCVDTDQQRYAMFRTAVDKEESFWKGLFGELNDALKLDISDPEKLNRIMLVRSMAARPLPTFAEYPLRWFGNDDAEKQRAAEYIQTLRDRLREAMLDRKIVGAAIGDAIQAAAFDDDEAIQVAAKPTDPATAVADRSPTPVVPTGVSYDTQILSAGSPTGWDVDIFWCVGEDEGNRFGRARAAATALAQKADANALLAPGIRLGQVRLRALPIDQQRSNLYPVSGDSIVFDRGPGEKPAADAVWKSLETGSGLKLAPVISENPSKWYLSAFFCAAPAGPALTVPPPPSPA